MALQAAFSQVAGSLGAPQLGQGSSSSGGAPAPSAVVDLGVVGRGTKRVTPMPLPSGAAGQPILHDSQEGDACVTSGNRKGENQQKNLLPNFDLQATAAADS